MTSLGSAKASQRADPVVAVTCDADLSRCLGIRAPGAGQRVWRGGAGKIVSHQSHKEAEFARHIVSASPALKDAMTRRR